MTLEVLQTLWGGNNCSPHAVIDGVKYWLGPVKVRERYNTRANGWADAIECGPGEAIRQISPGSPFNFSKYEVVKATPELVAAIEREVKDYAIFRVAMIQTLNEQMAMLAKETIKDEQH